MTYVDVRRSDATPGVARQEGQPDGGRPHLRELIDLDARTTGGTFAVVGLGYVGLPTALSLLGSGARVIGPGPPAPSTVTTCCGC